MIASSIFGGLELERAPFWNQKGEGQVNPSKRKAPKEKSVRHHPIQSRRTIMNRLFLAGIVALSFLMFPSSAAADEAVTLTGEAVDISCYMAGKSGEGHAGCASACAAKDQPIGFVVGEGEEKVLYLVLGSGSEAPKDLLSAHMGKQIKVTGEASKKEGLNVLKVSSVDAG